MDIIASFSIEKNFRDLLSTNVPGQTDIPGNGDRQVLSDTNASPVGFYRLGVRMP